MKTKLTKGEVVAVVLHSRLAKPMVGTILVLTAEVGKTVGVQFESDVKGHTCDGRGENGKCLWVSPMNVFSPEEIPEQKPEKPPVAEFQNIEIDLTTGQIKI